LLVLEDHICNLELEQLKEMYNNLLNEFKKRADQQRITVSMYPPDFSNNIFNLASELFTEELYDKKMQFSAAVFRKFNKLFSNNFIMTKNSLVEKTFTHTIDFLCPEYNNIFRNNEYNNIIENISNDVEALNIVLEKICILSILYDKELRNYFISNVNPLRVLLKEKFNHFDDKFIIDQFNKINEKYSREMENIFYNDLKRYHYIKPYSQIKYERYISKNTNMSKMFN